jgi:hypothetical protein
MSSIPKFHLRPSVSTTQDLSDGLQILYLDLPSVLHKIYLMVHRYYTRFTRWDSGQINGCAISTTQDLPDGLLHKTYPMVYQLENCPYRQYYTRFTWRFVGTTQDLPDSLQIKQLGSKIKIRRDTSGPPIFTCSTHPS